MENLNIHELNHELNPDLDLKYLTEKRDNALEHFNQKLKSHQSTDENLHKSLDGVLRINKQVKLLEDIVVILSIISKETDNHG